MKKRTDGVESEELAQEPDRLEPEAEPGSEEDLRAAVEEYKARWQRAQADYQNMRRRSAAELEGALRRALQPLLEDLLLILDSLDMALHAPATETESRSLAAGVRLTRDQLHKVLADQGVREIPDGGTFDPAIHQAVATEVVPGVEAGTIVGTLRRGYLWGEGVLRHAEVRVAARPAEEPDVPTSDAGRERPDA